MKSYLILLSVFSSFFFTTRCASIDPGDSKSDKPLFLTPYIEKDCLEEGRRLAQVKPFLGKVKSYSGLLTVDKKYDSSLFFWYFPAEREASSVPLLVWLNGYSTSSTYSVFLQTGPYDLLTPDLKARETSWQKYYHMVYIDNPVGVGYSFTNSTEGYSADLNKTSANLNSALEQFLKLFPDLAGRELYLTGLSLGGKYIPALAHRIYKVDSLNLKGLFVGNPFFDVVKQMNFENYLYELGFIDRNQQPDLIHQQNIFKALSQGSDYYKFNEFSTNFWLSSNSYLVNITGLDNIFDYEDDIVETKYYLEFIQREDIKRALHVSGVEFNDGSKAMSLFGAGISFSVLDYIGEMAESLNMMFYAGQKDVSCAYPMLVDALMSVGWSGQEGYTSAPRTRLYKEDGRHVWGYLRNHKTLSDVMVRQAGHSAVTSQPDHVLWLLHFFTDYKRFE